jgi:molybdate transport system substrate-binding protein
MHPEHLEHPEHLILWDITLVIARSRACRIITFVAVILWYSAAALAQDVRVMTSGAFTEACTKLAPAFEQTAGHRMELIFGASMGSGPDTIPSRLGRHEAADVVILARSALDELAARGFVIPDSRVDLVRSRIGMAVRAGAPRPDISSVEALRQTLLGAKSIGYSSSASGVYLTTELFPRLGIADQIRPKLKMSEGTVGTLVATGEVEIGFQQISELLPVPGIDYVGPLPTDAQRETIFAAGIVAWSSAQDLARRMLEFFTSSANAEAIRKTGLEPIAATKR